MLRHLIMLLGPAVLQLAGQPLPGRHPLRCDARDAFALCLPSKPELTANPQGRQLRVTLQVQEAGGSGSQHTRYTVQNLTALHKGLAQGTSLGASAPLSHSRGCVYQAAPLAVCELEFLPCSKCRRSQLLLPSDHTDPATLLRTTCHTA